MQQEHSKGAGRLISAAGFGGRVRAIVLDAREVIEALRQAHDTEPAVTAALGRTALGALLFAAAQLKKDDQVVTVRFDAATAPDLGWEFRPLTRQIRVRPGEPHEVFYRATNRAAEPVIGTATYNVTPTKSGIYFDKLQCFCFEEQRLEPGESRDMGVVFFVNPDLVKDPSTRDVRTITLSYTMFRKLDAVGSGAASSTRTAAQVTN